MAIPSEHCRSRFKLCWGSLGADSHLCSNFYPHSDGNVNTGADANTDTNANTDSDTNADGDTDTDANANSDTDAYPFLGPENLYA